jgi:hypothetical protein
MKVKKENESIAAPGGWSRGGPVEIEKQEETDEGHP